MCYKTQGHYKSSDLSRILNTHFGKSMNLARIKVMSMMICALCKVQQVAYTKLAAAFDNEASASSSLRRIQRFIAECVIDTDLIAQLILKLIPVSGPYDLAMDRTNWKFSDTNINILTLGIIYEGMAFPVVFKMMDKRGNSNTEERIELVNRFLRIAGHDSIGHLMADREFVGSEWLEYLNAMGIHYHIRIRENFKVVRHGQETRAFWLFNDVRLGEGKHLDGIYYVNGQACYLSGSKVKDKDGKPELQILVSYCNAEEALEMYRRRWQIETRFFKWLKQRLKIKKFWGNTENAVRIQIYTAITAYCMMAIVQKKMKIDRSIYEMLQMVSVSLTETLPLDKLFGKPNYNIVNELDESSEPTLF